jgi:hypothetical protein
MVVVPATIDKDILALAIAATAILDGAKVALFQNNLNPDKDTQLADITPADFTGYATSSAVVWGTPGFNLAGDAVVAAGSKQFQAGSPATVANVIYGWYLVDTTGLILLASDRFPAPVNVSAPLQLVDVVATFPVEL